LVPFVCAGFDVHREETGGMKAVRWLLEAELSHLCSLKGLMFFMGLFCVGASLVFAGEVDATTDATGKASDLLISWRGLEQAPGSLSQHI
jgi:hypothetical protein